MPLKQKDKINKLLNKINENLLLKNGIKTIHILSESNFEPIIGIIYLNSSNDIKNITEEELISKLEDILKIREEKLRRILGK